MRGAAGSGSVLNTHESSKSILHVDTNNPRGDEIFERDIN